MKRHDPSNEDCPLNDPETFLHPASRGLDCECPEVATETEIEVFSFGITTKSPVSQAVSGTHPEGAVNVHDSEIEFRGRKLSFPKGTLLRLRDSRKGDEVTYNFLYKADGHQKTNGGS